ncbi:uncharacterized protein N7496_010626 [Penicillium cataractarum]|uniref:Condensation domain-containing protein n=1 Tax=Penicillium cataractarum TaxID=2100454 RepID=A0A9W9V126_9EURO|nr:uncharacterized protein N7496_010626 [Penicillium cataractarum]KAJ5364913.1 hypothetical protein N7496_010626 [Penicillium cataractarum]
MAISSNDRFEWKLTKPGRWERDIDEVEEFYTSLAKAFEGTGRVFFAMTGFISFSIPVQTGSDSFETEKRVETALKNAWTRLRFDHPTIASRVQFDPAQQKYKKTYETFTDSASQRQWLDDTFRVVPERISGLEWCNSDPPVPALPTLFLIKSPTSNGDTFRADLVLRSHHDIIDGMGTLLLFNNLFSLAADAYEQTEYDLPPFGDEWSNLSPPLRMAAGIPASLSPEHEEQMRGILQHNASLKEDIETASPPFQRQSAVPGKHQRVAVTLSEDTTARVLEKCRSLGLSITHAYHAAIALAVRDLQERKESERMVRYISYCLVNERHHCNPPYSTSAHPATVYHSVSGRCLAVDLTVHAVESSDGTPTDEEEFLPIAQHIRDYYLDIRDDVEYIKLIPAFWAMSISPYPGPDPPVIPARNESPSASISSMGVLDKAIRHNYGSFSVDDPWVTGEELGTGLGVFLGTWKGRLTLSAAYNDAWHGKEEVLDVLSRCNDVSLQGLGIGEATSF